MNPDQWGEKKLAKRKAAKKRDRVAEAARRLMVSHTDVSIQREVAHIIDRATQRDSRVVVIGELVLFSTARGDAWLLDTDDQTAVCLARAGESQGARIVETPTQFAIEWEGTYTIVGDVFRVRYRSGTLSSIAGYPMAEIQRAIARHTQLVGQKTRLASD
ncbi:MAG: hypothetical protein ACKV2Q_22810 [Planctomycetaceae bacterium]